MKRPNFKMNNMEYICKELDRIYKSLELDCTFTFNAGKLHLYLIFHQPKSIILAHMEEGET